MKVPRWYFIELAIWLCTGLPFQWLMTAFNGAPFFSLPDAPLGDGPPVGLWLFAILFLYHPLFLAPVALWQSRAHRVKVDE